MSAVTRKRVLLHKSRKGGDSRPFAMLPVDVLTSNAVRTLPHVAFRVLVALAAQCYGVNNGSLSLTRRTAIDYGVGNTHTLYAALEELQVRGLIRQTRLGTHRPPRSAFYALTWWQIHEPDARDPHDATPTLSASEEWRQWNALVTSPHWTVRRRIPRWRRATQAGGARPPENNEMGGARPSKGADSSVAHGHSSDISGVGDHRPLLYDLVGRGRRLGAGDWSADTDPSGTSERKTLMVLVNEARRLDVSELREAA